LLLCWIQADILFAFPSSQFLVIFEADSPAERLHQLLPGADHRLTNYRLQTGGQTRPAICSSSWG
jgi:hypothetical protein